METESFKVDDEVADRVHDLVTAKAYPRDRVKIAIRRIADILEQEAEIAVLHPDLRVTLSSVATATEPRLSPALAKDLYRDDDYPDRHPPHDTSQ